MFCLSLLDIFWNYRNYHNYKNQRTKKIIYEQIVEYYNFHNQLKTYFNEGINYEAKKKKEKLYFVNSDWISIWKYFVNYEKAIKHINSYNNFIKNVDY
jgi:hypothetical protein